MAANAAGALPAPGATNSRPAAKKGGETRHRAPLFLMPSRARAPAERPRTPRLTDRDLRLLAFIAEHRLILAAHAQVWLGVSAPAAYARLRSLTSAGYLARRTIFHGQPGCYQITRGGLAAVATSYQPPRIDLNCYGHDVGVAWLWLAAGRGAFGAVREVISERRLRSHDATAERAGRALGVRLGGYGAGGKPRLHYPDLLLVLPGGQRVAVELELTGKGRRRTDKILTGCAADPRIDAVLYLVEKPAIARAIQSSARRAGIADRVHVQAFRWGGGAKPGPSLDRGRAHQRAADGPGAMSASADMGR